MSDFVLDASALLAFIQDETGRDRVFELLATGRCIASAVNISEVAAKLADEGTVESDVVAIIDRLHIEVVPFDRSDALEGGRLRPATRSLGLSLADRACLALALRLGLPVVTTDRQWANLNIGVHVELAR